MSIKFGRQRIVAALAMLVCTGVASGVPMAAQTAREREKALYVQYCAVCHGPDGMADTPLGRILEPPPRKFADPVAMARVTDDRIHQAIQQGIPHTAMAAWGRILDEQQIRDLASYVRSLERPRPAGMTQADFDAQVGGRIYRSYCVVCHGLGGNAETTIGRSLTDHPQDFTNTQAMARLSDADMAQAIGFGKPGTAMVAWRSLLSPEDIKRIVLFIRRQLEPPR